MNFEVNSSNVSITLKPFTKNEIDYIEVKGVLEKSEVPEKITLSCQFDSVDIYSTWSPSVRFDRTLLCNEWKQRTSAFLATWMPLHQLVSKSGENRICIAISDTEIPTEISTGIIEENAKFNLEISLFTALTCPISEFSVLIRIDRRNIPYYDSIYDTVFWWETECGYTPAPTPDCATEPVDSLWYSFHQQLTTEEIIKECALSKEMGMETVIVDDGWQTDDNSRGYAYCGDWEIAKSKIPDMKALVDKIHSLGMKFMLWYSVPFIGGKSKKYEEFKGMYLDENGVGMGGTYVLDPRYKKVRDYLINTYTDAVKTYGYDGLKLDFIDRFVLSENTKKDDPRRDYQSLSEATDVMMKEIKERLTEINPDIMIEFRQSYVGPSIRQYGNMLRVTDCPNDAIKNRLDIINLRFTSGKTAVHSDMIMWNKKDTVESAANQFVSVLYSVPQISVKIDTLPESHKKMLKFYLDFWKQNKDVLIGGRLTADNPEDNYSRAVSVLGDRAVHTAYSNPVVEVKTKEFVAVNATGNDTLIIKGGKGKKYKILNCMGEETGSGVLDSISEIAVSHCGMIIGG